MLNKSKGWIYSLSTTAFPSFCTDILRWWLSKWKASAPYTTETFYHQLGYCPTSHLIFTECVYSVASDAWHPHFLIPIFNNIYWHLKVKQQSRRKHLDCQNSRRYVCTWCFVCNTLQKVKIHKIIKYPRLKGTQSSPQQQLVLQLPRYHDSLLVFLLITFQLK